MGCPLSNLEVRKGKSTDGRLQQRINNSQQEDLRPRVPRVEGVPSDRQMPRHNVAWALADIEPATGEHSVEDRGGGG